MKPATGTMIQLDTDIFHDSYCIGEANELAMVCSQHKDGLIVKPVGRNISFLVKPGEYHVATDIHTS